VAAAEARAIGQRLDPLSPLRSFETPAAATT